MNKRIALYLILLFLALLIAIFIFCKPYLRHEKISTSEGYLIIQTNLITSTMRFFDSTTMRWYEEDEYINLRIRKINEQFDNLYIKKYQTLLNILEGKDKDKYSFISLDEFTELSTKNTLIMNSANGEEIIRKRAELLDEFNKLVNYEREKRINEIQGFIIDLDFSNKGII